MSVADLTMCNEICQSIFFSSGEYIHIHICTSVYAFLDMDVCLDIEP